VVIPVGFEVLAAVMVRSTVFWDVKLCCLIERKV
jgi:hypothetical protein